MCTVADSDPPTKPKFRRDNIRSSRDHVGESDIISEFSCGVMFSTPIMFILKLLYLTEGLIDLGV